MGDQEELKELQQIFLQTNRKNLEALNAEFASGNLLQMGQLAHTIKASVDIWEIAGLKNVIREIERIGKSGIATENLELLLAQLNEGMLRTFEEIAAEAEVSSGG